jgi:hypothetical protein
MLGLLTRCTSTPARIVILVNDLKWSIRPCGLAAEPGNPALNITRDSFPNPLRISIQVEVRRLKNI